MEIGEPVEPPDFVSENSEVHDKDTCPWCQSKMEEGKSEKMEAQDPQADAVGAIPPTDGGKLGRRLRKAKQKKPEDTIAVVYRKGAPVHYESGKDMKTLTRYEKMADGETVPYRVQYAPHHLIPGNESLDGSTLVPYMGDDNAISEYSGGQSSKIKNGGFIGYDVNSAENGEWLPSPYALSMKNDWPAEEDVEVVKRRKGLDLGPVTEAFKAAYVAAAIESSGRQFHMRHKAYSEKVQAILEAMAERLRLFSEQGMCPVAKNGEEDGRFEPPHGLVVRLNVLSSNLRRLVVGRIWRPPMYADGRTEEYAKDLERIKDRAQIERVI